MMEWKAIIKDPSAISDSDRVIAGFRTDLKNGILFFKRTDEKTPLLEVQDILQYLAEGGHILVDDSKKVEVTNLDYEIVLWNFEKICKPKSIDNSIPYTIVIKNLSHCYVLDCSVVDDELRMNYNKFIECVNWVCPYKLRFSGYDLLLVLKSKGLEWTIEKEYAFPLTLDKLSLLIDTYLYRYVMLTDGNNVVRSLNGNIAKLRTLEESEKEVFQKSAIYSEP